ncbi:uncharacterized protein LAESUDRAFT_816047 [Laetiporus sulphureus 93-53]|uniref:F-box domain-containing protein n=1 Tax=Laetiporus sulphureus 93-53 TaxID=1314785 RepID=A0A165BL05_9APHY|nr:uncharacterized protein LAESUDRAFT_816047 [Laetiporus sulphureus 93-53]KZT01247.1 hypothetical protein LAESUDRAFT_816047 [Laetiporus sulphureus 93-53]
MQIVEEAVRDHHTARALSQVCSWARQIALPRLYNTLFSITDTRDLTNFPSHLRPYVQNVWLDKSPPPTISDSIAARTSWLWSTVRNLCVPLQFLEACDACEHLPEKPAPFTVRTLTIFDAKFCSSGHRVGTLLSSVTHLRVAGNCSSWGYVTLIRQLTSLKYLMVPLDESNGTIQVISTSMLARRHPTLQKIALLMHNTGVGFTARKWCTTANIIMQLNDKLYLVPAVCTQDEERKEWESIADGEEFEDTAIWQKAKRMRAAILAGDEEEVARICGVSM